MSLKPKIAFYWCAACGGCEEAVVDLAEGILPVVEALDIVFWPVAMDFKRRDVEALPDGSILAGFVNGAIRTSEQETMARLIRKKSQLLLAFGACSHLGGIPGLANLYDRESLLRRVYIDAPSMVNPEGRTPQTHVAVDGHELELPRMFDTVRTLDQVVDVDYYVPGCPPTPKVLSEAIRVLMSGNLPAKGTVLAPDRALCDECPRRDSRPEKLALQGFKRPHQIHCDEAKCMLSQGLLCLGPATRAGCEALCTRGNMPCTGCFGPTSRVLDYGAKVLSSWAAMVDSSDEDAATAIFQQIPDPIATLYRYSLPSSFLRRKRPAVARSV